MERNRRHLAAVLGALAMWSGTAAGSPIPPASQVDTSTCIGSCALWPLVPGPTGPDDAGAATMQSTGVTTTETQAFDNDDPADDPFDTAGAGDSTLAEGTSTYGGALESFARAISGGPLSTGTEIAGTTTTSLWYGEFEVGGAGSIPLDMTLDFDATLSIGDGESAYADVGVQVGIITIDQLENDALAPLLFAAGLIGSVFQGSVAVNVDPTLNGGSPEIQLGLGPNSGDLVLDDTSCPAPAPGDCTLGVSVTGLAIGGGMSFTAGENVLVLASLGTSAVADQSTAGTAISDAASTMNVTLGRNFTLVPLVDAPEPGTLLLAGAALLGIAGARRRRSAGS